MGITPIYLRAGDMPHIFGKLSTRAITKRYGPPKSQESQFKKFQDSNLRVLGQNDIWVLAPWPNIDNTIRGKVVVSPKFGPWWILWICVCSWLLHAPKVLQLSINQLWVKKRSPTPYLSIVFTFGLTIEFIKEFRGVSKCFVWID